MGDTIQVKRGNNANLGSLVLLDGEFAFVKDTEKLYIGDAGVKKMINPTPTKDTVGLGNVTNESKATMFTNPVFTGIPTAPTAPDGTNTTQLATTAFVALAISKLVDSSPATLDTLNELAQALADDPNFATTMTNALTLKAPIASPLFTGTPKAPTPATADNSTTIATTAFVKSQNYLTNNSDITIDGGTF